MVWNPSYNWCNLCRRDMLSWCPVVPSRNLKNQSECPFTQFNLCDLWEEVVATHPYIHFWIYRCPRWWSVWKTVAICPTTTHHCRHHRQWFLAHRTKLSYLCPTAHLSIWWEFWTFRSQLPFHLRSHDPDAPTATICSKPFALSTNTKNGKIDFYFLLFLSFDLCHLLTIFLQCILG